MFRTKEPVSIRVFGQAGVYHKECTCGRVLWEGCLPSYHNSIVCMGCGRNWSRKPPLWFRLRYGLYLNQKRARLYGMRKALRMGLRSAFLIPREIEERKQKTKAAEDKLKELTDGFFN